MSSESPYRYHTTAVSGTKRNLPATNLVLLEPTLNGFADRLLQCRRPRSLSNTDLEALFRKGGGDGMGEGTAVGTGAALCDPKCGPAKAAPAEPNSGLRLPDNVIRKLCNVVSGAAHRDDSAAPTSRQQIADSSSGACPEDERKVNLNASLSSKLGKSNKAQEELFFRLSRARQTMDFVKRQYQRFGTLDRSELTIFEALAKLDTVHEFEANMLRDDASDIPLTQLEHAFQTAEILREAHPKDDWLHLVGLIHGLGKLLRHADFGMEPEWSVFGEAFPVGCRFSEMIKHSQLFYANPDRRNRQHNSLEGIYTPGCGLHEVNLSWSAAEYLYLVLYLNGTDFPGEALYCIRYQRFDSMVAGAYKPLMSPEDWLWLPWLKKLRAAAAYKVVEPVLSRVRNESCMREMQTYYQGLIEKYIGSCRLYW
eukprot:jgi/Tetstr1/426022/TSEL_016368.t1